MVLTAEMILSTIKLAGMLAGAFKGRATFADGTVLTQAHIDEAYKDADAVFQRVEDRAQAELDKLTGGTS